ncbi:BMC domain-containing protein [Calidifontibacillus oryziterrae]|uniref:BMC domain-containing protein n=1 Tax=Calidifontibacillus oryziterrae TaxID=1191699 RepID=UPI0002D54C58|nr:BMC domain-containing protein [Calidifontibacillus oryziterrae]
MNKSLGIIEVTGMVTAIACIDAMTKSAFVDLYKVNRVGSGLIAIFIKGDLASVLYAIDIGQAEAMRHGELVAYRVIPRPYKGLYSIVDK